MNEQTHTATNDLTQSSEINELAKALTKVQKSMVPAKKDAENPFFKSSYSTLTSIWEAARNPLSENGLAVTQTTTYRGGQTCIITTLMHVSGQWIRGILPIAVESPTPQQQGSGITYARRYALAAIIGITQDDDDAQIAEQAQSAEPKTYGSSTSLITEKQERFLWAKAKAAGLTGDGLKTLMFEKTKKENSRDLTKGELDEILKMLSN